MSEILRKWLRNKLGLVLDYNLESFEEIAFDGTLLAKVLHNYGFIDNDALYRVKKTCDTDIALKNWHFLKCQLRSIGVDCTDKIIYDIVYKKESKAIFLFYQLYVALNTKTKVNCLINKNIEEAENSIIKDVVEIKPVNVCQKNQISTSKDFPETKQLINWHRNNYAQLLERCEEVRNTYIRTAEKKLRKIPKYVSKVSDQILGVSKPIVKKSDFSKNFDPCIPDNKIVQNYVTYLNKKLYKVDKYKMAQTQMHKILLSNLINTMIKKEDDEFKEIISNSLLKQSAYEKQITTKLIDVRHQKNIILENLQAQHKILNKRKEQEFIDKLLQQNINLTIEEKRFIQNLNRQLELHRRLWAEKCARRYARHYEMCHNIVEDCIDLSIKSIEYEILYNREVPNKIWKQWMTLFTTNQSIFDIVENVTDILDLDEENPDELLTLELYRQNGLDESDLNDYLNATAIWDIEEAMNYYNQHCETIDLGNQIFGYVIHRLLKLKYPCPPPHPTPELPRVDVRACLIGVQNAEIVNVLQECLDKHHIAVIDLTNVINFCLDAYLKECEIDVDKKLNEESKKGKKKGKKGKKEKSSKKDKKSKKSKKSKAKSENIIEKIEKEVQTPRLFPGEELILSETAELGKAIYETLNLGLEVNDLLLIDSLIVYLKQLNYTRGWILVNFPATVEQALVFEEIFTGRSVPDMFKEQKYEVEEEEEEEEEEELEKREDIYKSEEDLYEFIRISKLLPSHKPPCPEEYESYLTSFVHMFIKNNDFNQNILDDQNITNPYENKLTKFYTNVNINSIHVYEKVDHDLLRDLIYLITKDEVFAKLLYEEILIKFKNIIQSKKKAKEDGKKSGKSGKSGKSDKKKKGKSQKKEKKSNKSSDKSSKKDKKSKKDGKKEKVEKEIEKPYEEQFVIEEYKEPPKPGEPNWEYVQLPLINDISKYLSTLWQQLEEVYLNDFKEIFFTKRVYQNQIIPYINELEIHMQDFIDRPDMKQEHLHEFQKIYNEIDKDLREDDEFKAELHNKLSEFRDKLWCISDERMKECESERQRLINDNWFVNHCFAEIIIYGKAFQLELDRCMVSLQILQDYYSAMAMQIPIEQKLSKCSLNFESYMKNSSYNLAASVLAKLFSDVSLDTKQNPFVDFIKKTHETALNCFSSWKSTTASVVKMVQGKFSKKEGKVKKKKKEPSKLAEVNFEINDKIDKMIEEWTMALDGEILRTHFRLKLILEKAIDDISDNLYFGEQTFHDIYERIDERYHEEVECIDNVCQLFARAIEACEPIQSRLILNGTDFMIDQNKLFYMDEPFKYDKVKERIYNAEFTIANLTKLVYIFFDLAPEINMPDRVFIFLLQDMVVQKSEDDYKSPLPAYWQLLNHNDVPQLVQELYGDSEYIDWKDFIIWNLILPYPTEYELLEMREKFLIMDPDEMKYVNCQQFFSVFFWFEDDYDCEDLRIRLIKKLLYIMFMIFPEKVDYMSMLFYFCKDVELIRGISKAIELLCGDFICWDVEIGRRYMKHLWHLKKLEDERQKEILSAVNSVLNFISREVDKQIDTVSEILGVPTEEQSVYEEEILEEEKTFTMSSLSDDLGEGEEARGELPNIVYFLDFDLLINVMTIAYPWEMNIQSMDDKSLLEKLEELFEKHRHKHFDNQVFVHEFLNDPEFIEIINKNSKFLERNPSDIVRKLIEICTCNVKREY